jgi:hypothetical protein
MRFTRFAIHYSFTSTVTSSWTVVTMQYCSFNSESGTNVKQSCDHASFRHWMRNTYTKYFLIRNYHFITTPTKLTMTEPTTSLAPWKLHNRLVDIVRSDASPILDIIPSYNTLQFSYNKTENTIALHMGVYGDSEILAHPNGTVSKRVIRDSKIRKAGTVLEVSKPMSGQYRAVAPFGWSETLQYGISTPMSAPTHALVLMYMHIWALKTDKKGIDLPIPGYQSLHGALGLIRKTVETELMLPVGQRKIPAEVLAGYQTDAVDRYRLLEKKGIEEGKS